MKHSDGLDLDVAGGVATVTLNSPPVNTLTLARYEAIGELFGELGERDDVQCVLFTGAGERAFCAGLDLSEFVKATVEEDPARAAVVRECFRAVRHCKVPVVCAVNGPALGAGAVLAAVSDIRVASERATFVMSEINVGRCGGASHMGRLLPQGTLRLMYFTAEPMSAWEAHRLGFVERIVPPKKLMATAGEIAATIATKSPIGLRMAKEALNKCEQMQIEAGYELEQSYSTRLMQTEDAREAAKAVLEKRKPVFKGR